MGKVGEKVGGIIIGSVLTVAGVALGQPWMTAAGVSMLASGVSGLITGLLSRRQEGMQANITSNVAAVPVVYGTAKIGLRIIETRAYGSGNKFLARVGVLCMGSSDGSGIEGVTKVYFDDRLAIDAPTFENEPNTTGIQSPFSGELTYGLHAGSDTQTVDAELNNRFPTEWPSTARGLGIAYLALFMEYDTEVYPRGIPNVTAIVKGVRVYDPRDATWKWSDNPALCIRDYLTSTRYGCGIPAADIDDASFIAAANYCDEMVNTTAANQKRFTCNGWIDTDRPLMHNLNELLSSCRGVLVYQGGKFRLVIRRPTTAASFTLNEDNIIGDWSITRMGSDQVPNYIRATFINPAKDYQPDTVTWPEAGAANGFLTADNNLENLREVDLPFTDNVYRAQQIIMTLLRESRQDVLIGVTCKEEALKLQVGDVVRLTHPTPGFTAKEFWVANVVLLPDGNVRLLLQEYDANAYTLDTQNTQPTVPGSNLPNPFSCVAPTNLVLASGAANALATQDGLYIPRIKATFDAALEPFLVHYEVQYKKSADTQWIDAPRLPADQVETFITPVTNGVNYDVRVRAVNTLSVPSAWVTVTGHTVTTQASTSQPGGATAKPPQIVAVHQSAGGTNAINALATDVRFRIEDPHPGSGGTLRVWSDPTLTTSPDPDTDAPDATVALTAGDFGINGAIITPTLVSALNEIRANSQFQKTIYVEYVSTASGLSTGKYPINLIAFVHQLTPGGRVSSLDDNGKLTTGVVSTALIGDKAALEVTRRSSLYFLETCDSVLTEWNDSASVGTMSIVAGEGTVGPNVLRVSGGRVWKYFPLRLPVNPAAVYRCRVRFRVVTNPTTTSSGGDPTAGRFYFGFRGRRADGSFANSNSGNMYVVQFNGAYHASDGWIEVTTWVKGATLAFGATPVPSTDPKNPAPLNVGTVTVEPLIGMLYAATDGVADLDYFEILQIDEGQAERVYAALEIDGVLQQAVKQYNGSALQVLAKGRITGVCRHGDTVNFPSGFFQTPPMILMRGGISYQPDGTKWSPSYSTTAPQYDDMAALNVTAAQFVARARLRQKGVVTARSHNFGAGTLTSVGASLAVNLDNAPANDDTYRVYFSFSLTGSPDFTKTWSWAIEIAIDSNDGSGWVERAVIVYGELVAKGADPDFSVNDSRTIVVSGLDSTDDIRVRIKSMNAGPGYTMVVDPDRVEYNTSSDSFASKTPDTDDVIEYEALEVS